MLVYVLSFGSVPLSVTNRGHVAALINQSLARLNRGGARSVAVVFVVAVNGVARATQSRGHVAAYVNQLVTGVNHFLASESWPRYETLAKSRAVEAEATKQLEQAKASQVSAQPRYQTLTRIGQVQPARRLLRRVKMPTRRIASQCKNESAKQGLHTTGIASATAERWLSEHQEQKALAEGWHRGKRLLSWRYCRLPTRPHSKKISPDSTRGPGNLRTR